MDGVLKKIQGRVLDVRLSLMREAGSGKCLFFCLQMITVLLSKDEWELQGIVNEFENVCKKCNLKLNATKNIQLQITR